MNDEKIVELYINRNEVAISETQKMYGAKLNRLSYNIIKNRDDADECENDTYLQAWNNIPPKSPGKYLFSFLAKITRNITINLYKKNHTQKRFAHIVELTREMEECIPSPSDEYATISDSDLTENISKFLYTIKPTEREIFVKRYWYAMSVIEIAVSYNFTESKVKSMLMRTRNKLKKYFESEGIEI